MTPTFDDAIELIGATYDAAFDSALWPSTLSRIADAIGCPQIMMGVSDGRTRSMAILAPRMDPACLQSYLSHWGAGDILWQRSNQAPVGKVLLAEALAPRAEFTATELFNEWQRPQGIGVAGLAVNLPTEGPVPAVCGAKRSQRNDEFDDRELALFGLLAPHLVRATEVQRRLWHLSLQEELAIAGLNRQDYGVILLDAAARVLFANRVAESLIDSKDGFHVDARRLSTTDGSAANALARMVASCANRRPNHEDLGGSLLVPRGVRRAPLRVAVAPFRAATRQMELAWLGFGRPAAILMITDPDRQHQVRKEDLRRRFGFTPAEADVALEILRGDGREAAAARLGIAATTVKTHLIQVFEKTGARRQAELVRLLLGPTERDVR